MKWALVLIVALLLAGCAQGTPVPATVEPEPEATAVATAAPVVEAVEAGTYFFLAANNSDPFYIPGVKGFTESGNELGVRTEFVGPMDLNLAAQMKTFEELVASPETKGIFWYPMDFNAGEPFIVEAKAKGIPVVIGAADSPYKTRVAFIGYDNNILGIQAADWACQLVEGEGVIGSIGVTGPNVTQRQEAFAAQLKANCPGVTVVERTSHDGSAENATKQLDAYLIANPELKLLWWADGLAGQMAQPWKERQEAGAKALFLGTDMPPATLEAVRDGVFVGSVGQDTSTEARWGLRLVYAAAHGERVPDTLYLSAILVDKDNVGQFLEE